MTTYRLCGLDAKGQTMHTADIQCDDTKSLWEAAKSWLNTYPQVEGWEAEQKRFTLGMASDGGAFVIDANQESAPHVAMTPDTSASGQR